MKKRPYSFCKYCKKQHNPGVKCKFSQCGKCLARHAPNEECQGRLQTPATGLAILIGILLLVGCTQVENVKDAVKGSEPIQCPVCQECQECGQELDAAFFTFTDHEPEMFKLVYEADHFLYCTAPTIYSPRVAERIVQASQQIGDVRILLDKDTTMDCNNGCIPRRDNQYNTLFAADVKMKTAAGIHGNWCVTEDALLLTSSNIDGTNRFDTTLVVKSPGLIQKYRDQFLDEWGKQQ